MLNRLFKVIFIAVATIGVAYYTGKYISLGDPRELGDANPVVLTLLGAIAIIMAAIITCMSAAIIYSVFESPIKWVINYIAGKKIIK